MKRLLMSVLSVLALSIVAAPAAQAETTPDDLVNMARTGFLEAQGIPSHDGLAHAIRFGQVSAQDLIEAGVAENRLSAEALESTSYRSRLEARLQSFLRWH